MEMNPNAKSKGKSQYDEDINERIRSSACGPVTAHVLMEYISYHACPYDVNELYRRLGGTVVGLSKGRFIRNLRKVLGPDWKVNQCTLEELKRQIDEGRPVAAKFDKWSSLLSGLESALNSTTIGFQLSVIK